MQIMTKRIGAIMLAACLLVVLAFGSVMAWGEGEASNSLTVELSGAAYNDETITPDIEAKDVTYDVYQIASGVKDLNYDTYNYVWDIDNFKELTDRDKAAHTASAWKDIADDAAGIVARDSLNADKTGIGGEELTGLQNGLFLSISNLYCLNSS